jgi:hypothetical protein
MNPAAQGVRTDFRSEGMDQKSEAVRVAGESWRDSGTEWDRVRQSGTKWDSTYYSDSGGEGEPRVRL